MIAKLKTNTFVKMKLLLFFVFSFIIFNCTAQSVDPLTGRAIVNLPLGSVSALDISVGVSLSHHGGALRVAEGPGNAGMGWNVNMGGSISREVRGLPDEINSGGKVGWLSGAATTIQNFTPSADDNLAVCTDETTDWNTINSLGYVTDPEPDIYYFQAPGISGKFIYGTDGLPKLIPYQDLKIVSSVGVFTITTNNGTVYTFGTIESISRQSVQFKSATPVNYRKSNYNYFTAPISFAATWHLSTIQSTASGAVANFSYQILEESQSFQYVTGIEPGTNSVVDTLYYIKDIGTPMALNQITLNNYSINVIWANGLVDKITVNESETEETKAYDFVYKSIKSNSDNAFPQVSKPFLIQIKQQNSCLAFPAYAFAYDGVDTVNNIIAIPWRTGWGQDFFGYYNGQNQSKNIPTVYFYQSESGARRLRVTPIPGVSATQTHYGVTSTSMNVNNSYTKIGALTGIAFPTGSYTGIAYEGNTYVDSSTGEQLAGPGIRVSEIATSGGDYAGYKSVWHTMTKTFQYGTTNANTTTSGKLLYPPEFAFTDGTSIYRSQSDLGQGSEVMYSRVKESIPNQGYRVYLFDLPNMYPDASSAAPASKVARASGASCSAGLLQNGSYTWPYAPVRDLGYMRGVLINMSEYTAAGALTQEKRLTYITPQSSVTLKGLRFESINNVFFYSSYEIPVAQSRILSQETVRQIGDQSAADSTKSTSAYMYNSRNMLTRTTLTNDDGSVSNQYMSYSLDYNITSPAAGDLQAAAINKLNTTNRYGEVIETYQTFKPRNAGSATTTTGAKLNLFKDYGTVVFPYQSKNFPTGLGFTPSFANTGGTQGFVSDSDYILDATYDYANSLPVNQTGMSLISSGTHYSSGTAMPIANFVNCKAENAVFDGFELVNARGLTYSGPNLVKPAGWTGKKSIQLDRFGSLSTSINATKLANENTYRISCWAYAAQATNIIATANTTQATLTLNYTTPNKWTYLEGFMDMTSVSSLFSLQITTNLTGAATISLDEFIAIPKSARVSSRSFLPLTGVTSQTDDRGNSTIVNYDVMGRKSNTQDRQRNVVEVLEYGLQLQGKLSLNPNFTTNVTQYTQGQSVVFTAAPSSCISAITYVWTFTDSHNVVTTGSGSQYTKALTSFGAYAVKLTVSAPGYGTASFEDVICVSLGGFSPVVNVSPSNVYHLCALTDEQNKTFTASIGGNANGWSIQYTWYVTDNNGNWNIVAGTTNQIQYVSPAYTYQVKCIMTATDTAAPTNASLQCLSLQYIGTAYSGVTYINNSPCQ